MLILISFGFNKAILSIPPTIVKEIVWGDENTLIPEGTSIILTGILAIILSLICWIFKLISTKITMRERRSRCLPLIISFF